ncbi:MAG TPA: Hsp70 family protein [Kiritimatiellia bacterium]|nr:Hsp70 family protein [Kiritimatiellia bacterium]
MSPTFALGLDLGTTNCALAYLPLNRDDAPVELLSIPQLVAPGQIESRPLLPSFLYLPAEAEKDQPAFRDGSPPENPGPVGELARKQSADVPTRTIAAAKSWLAHHRVDRNQPILPWEAPEEVAKVSPVEASAAYLRHLVAAWNHAHPDALFHHQRVTLTVPASFDASARDLTRQAALAAGFPNDFILLEEPQAALYAWLALQGEQWRKSLRVGDVILVCDVGGGTSDFTLISVEERDGDLELNRLAVGNHILVGGDNMDLTLAHAMQQLFEEKGHAIDPWQAVSLWHACRAAKEDLFSHPDKSSAPVTILGRGRSVIGKAITADLTRDLLLRVLLHGFLPDCTLQDAPQRLRGSGFRQLGLPYESDTAITRHLAHFLARNARDGEAAIAPTRILFNGGVFKAADLRDRLTQILAHWFADHQTPALLEGHHDLDFAVARGAAAYGAIKERGGVRIRGGVPRAYYVGIETAGLAIPGAPRPLHALCVVPHGMEEGTSVQVPGGDIGLVVGEPVHFRFFSSATRKDDTPGTLLTRWTPDELEETDAMETALPSAENEEDGYVPVRFESRITELGVLELWCVSALGDERWKLEFSVREDD